MQNQVALSSTEAELYAASEAAQEALWLRYILSELKFDQAQATLIGEDNQAAIYVSESQGHHSTMKHIDTRNMWINDHVKANNVKLVKVPTAQNVADLLTKPLAVDGVRRHRSILLTQD
jgi:hypothetical protein